MLEGRHSRGGGRISRRAFLTGAAGGGLAGLLAWRLSRSSAPSHPPLESPPQPAGRLPAVDDLPADVTRTWLGPPYWANRLQDWRLHRGRIECVPGAGRMRTRTVAVLTRELTGADRRGRLSVRTGTLRTGDGFSGFLLGAGAGRLDHRAAALVQGASGTGGGILCTYESDGTVALREHTDEGRQFRYAVLRGIERGGPAPPRNVAEDVELLLDIAPSGRGRFTIRLTAIGSAGDLLAWARVRGVDGALLTGGIALVSASGDPRSGATHWFHGLGTAGAKVAARPERAEGPVLATLYSLNGDVLKLTAQLLPIGSDDPQNVGLRLRPAGGQWRDGPSARVGPGWVATFRITGWDAGRDAEYEVVYGEGTAAEQRYRGRIGRDPADRDRLTVGLLSCTIHSFRPLNVASPAREPIPGARPLGLYTEANLYFPYDQLVDNVRRQRPDLLAVVGDQYYENRPTTMDHGREPTLDMLYRWYLWLWSFRDLTRTTPTIVLVDDHDVYQSNLWGEGGAPAPGGDVARGGYDHAPGWVNLVQRVQCAHNPDAYDPRPVAQGITVYYGMFRYGGVSFAIVEDRKFKSPTRGAPSAVVGSPHDAGLAILGDRQERFLAAWARTDPDLPKVCLSQTIWAGLQTDRAGRPTWNPDTDSYPAARRSALRLLRQAGAILLSGDQHLASLVRHGLSSFDDGPVQFVAPAAGSAWQRWFEPAARLPHAGRTAHTGDFTDRFGNRMRVLAVANPKVSQATFKAHHPQADHNLGDRGLKREGYGVVRIDRRRREFVLECWPWDARPARDRQFPGWPYRLPFAAV